MYQTKVQIYLMFYFYLHDLSRFCLILCGSVCLLGWLLIFLSSFTTLYLVYPGLFLVGWSCGLSNPLSSIYVSQIAGNGNKGVVSSIFNFNFTFGVLFANVVGALSEYVRLDRIILRLLNYI